MISPSGLGTSSPTQGCPIVFIYSRGDRVVEVLDLLAEPGVGLQG
jgi:hypothetical protein